MTYRAGRKTWIITMQTAIPPISVYAMGPQKTEWVTTFTKLCNDPHLIDALSRQMWRYKLQ